MLQCFHLLTLAHVLQKKRQRSCLRFHSTCKWSNCSANLIFNTDVLVPLCKFGLCDVIEHRINLVLFFFIFKKPKHLQASSSCSLTNIVKTETRAKKKSKTCHVSQSPNPNHVCDLGLKPCCSWWTILWLRRGVSLQTLHVQC